MRSGRSSTPQYAPAKTDIAASLVPQVSTTARHSLSSSCSGASGTKRTVRTSLPVVRTVQEPRRMGVQGDLHTMAMRGHCFQRKASPGTGSYTYQDRIWEFMNHKRVNAP